MLDQRKNTITIIALTSVPPRFDGLSPVLSSLLNQGASRVVLVLARSYRRFPGLVLPPDLPEGVELLWSDDHGPASKLIPVQRAFPTERIAYCDDDCLYHPGWLQALDEVADESCVATGSTFHLARLKRQGDLVAQGFAGVLIPAGFAFDPPPDACRYADDLWLSAQMVLNGLQIVECPKARRLVEPLTRSHPLQIEARAKVYAQAAEHVHEVFGIWPLLHHGS